MDWLKEKVAGLFQAQEEIPVPVAEWLKKVEAVYGCMQERLSEKRWNVLLSDEVLQDENYREQAVGLLLEYLETHCFLKNNIFELIEKRLGVEVFQEFDYTDFPYEWFSKKGKADFDSYIIELNAVEECMETEDWESVRRKLEFLQEQALSHPYMILYRCIYQAEKGKKTKETAQDISTLMLLYSNDQKIMHYGVQVLWRCEEYQKAALVCRYFEEKGEKFAEADWCISAYEQSIGSHMTALQYGMDAYCQGNPSKNMERLWELYGQYLDSCERAFSDENILVAEKERWLEQYLTMELRMEGILAQPKRRILREHPEYTEVFGESHKYLGGLAYEKDDYEKCIQECRICRVYEKEKAENVLALQLEGYASRHMNKSEEAYVALAQAVQADKTKDWYLLLEMAKAANDAAKYKEALEATRNILKRMPDCFAAMLVRQMSYQHEHDVSQVRMLYEKMVRMAPDCPQCYELVSLNLCAYEQYDYAREILNGAKTVGIKTIRLLLVELVYLDKRMVSRMSDAEAEEREKSIIQEYTEGKFSKEELAGLYYELAMLSAHDPVYLNPKYLHFMNKSLKLYPDVNKFMQAARMENRTGSREKTLQYLEGCIEASMANAWGYMIAGVIQREKGNYEKCLTYLQRACELEPENMVALENLYNTYRHFVVELGQKEYCEECVKIIYRLIEGKPHNSAHYYCIMGKLYQAIGQEEEALVAFDRALSLKPNDTESLFEKGRILAARGEYEEARYCLTKSLFYIPELDKRDDWKLCPRFMEIAATYEAEDNIVAAKSWYQRGVDTLYDEKYKKQCKAALKKINTGS